MLMVIHYMLKCPLMILKIATFAFVYSYFSSVFQVRQCLNLTVDAKQQEHKRDLRAISMPLIIENRAITILSMVRGISKYDLNVAIQHLFPARSMV